MANVTEFRQLTPRTKPKAPTFNDKDRDEWVLAAKAVWADPARWRTSKKGNRYVVIDDLSVCVVIERTEMEYWTWEIRQRGREPVRSKWDYVSQQTAFDTALDAVIALV
jgi:hypothetical protein